MKKFLFLLVGLASQCLVSAQQPSSNKGGSSVIDVQVGSGVHSLSYSPSLRSVDGVLKGDANKEWGFNINGVFNRYFSQHIGGQTGVRLYCYRSKGMLDGVVEREERDVVNGLDFVRSVQYEDWEEQQTAFVLAIPVGLTYKTALFEKLDFVADGGVELLLPLNCNYKVKDGTINVAGEYEDYGVVIENLPVHNFTTYADSPKGHNNLKVGIAGYADAGIRLHLAHLSLSAAAYFSYGFSNVADSSSTALFDISNRYHGMLASQTVEDAHPFAAGVKLGVTLPVGR